VRGAMKGRPLERWYQYGAKSRGMSAWHDLIRVGVGWFSL